MNSTISFLQAVASAYTANYSDISDICFLFPNRRSGTFFLKALSECITDHAMLAPEVLSISDFMARISERETASRTDLLFRLYNVYKKIIGDTVDLSGKESLLDFDRFAPWAETLLNDFSEVDQFNADADALFQNVRDLRSIESNFLTEEQLEIMERYFGYRPSPDDVKGFWKTLDPVQDWSDLKQKFVELWKLLPELYHGLAENLEKDGLATPGGTFRIAQDRILEAGRDVLPWSKIVVVGFNMLSTTEVNIFNELMKLRSDDGEPFVEFFWDAAGPVLSPSQGTDSIASRAILRNIRNYPMPQWAQPYMARCEKTTMPEEIMVAAAPSNAAQVKVAMMQVKDWLEKEGSKIVETPSTAIIIPDEGLLLPLIHSLPEDVKNVNLTMGYSLKYTSVASFVYHLRRLQSRRRKSGEGYGYFHEDLRIFLSHPLLQLAVGTATINKMNSQMARNHIRTVPLEWIAERSPLLAKLLKPLGKESDVAETIAYISGALDEIDRVLVSGDSRSNAINSKMERAQIAHYQQALIRLQDSIEAHGIKIRPLGVFHLVDRILAGETVTFEGEPLQGMQIMGLLETRALDFDRLIILSMNDSIMPQRSRRRTYIPEALRHGYGLPSTKRGEELSAYYFYRLLSRAKHVILIYDARAGDGLRTGGKSRFIMQLQMLYGRGQVHEKVYSFGLHSNTFTTSVVEKTETVMRKLEEYKQEGSKKKFSASALMNYCQCPVKFYYKNVAGISDDDQPSDYIDAITQGNILHDTMLNLYFPAEELQRKYLDKRIVLTREDLQKILDNPDKIQREVIRAINKNHFHREKTEPDHPLEGSVLMMLPHFVRMVRNAIRTDMTNDRIELIGGELKDEMRWKVGSAPEVTFSFAFDRVDYVDGRLRIIDYKTGNADAEAKVMEEIFSGEKKAKYMLQLFLYSHLLEKYTDGHPHEKPLASDIQTLLVDANKSGGDGYVTPKVENKFISGHSQISREFLTRLEQMLNDIFDPSKPFETTDDPKRCDFCRFHALCGKE